MSSDTIPRPTTPAPDDLPPVRRITRPAPPPAPAHAPAPDRWPRVHLAGAPTDLLEQEQAIELIIQQAKGGPGTDVLGVVSINLDHIHHFGTAKVATPRERRDIIDRSLDQRVRWLALLDGAPLVTRAAELTGRPWPRLAGSDLINPILDRAAAEGLTIGFLGGAAETHAELVPVMKRRWPTLHVRGYWSPSRADLADPAAGRRLAEEIRDAGVDVLAVCLGKPRQEQWIAEHGQESGAKVCLAFGAVVDFLAGHVQRAPAWVSDRGFEWAWRLALEPRRLYRRYVVQGPPAYVALQRHSHVLHATPFFVEPATALMAPSTQVEPPARFAPADGPADVAVLVVTYNNAADVDGLIASLRRQGNQQSLRVVVADNGSVDDTLTLLAEHDDVIVVPTGGNLGYAGGINVARERMGDVRAVLVLNPDLELAPGAVTEMLRRLGKGAAVVVPQLLESNGVIYESLRYEPNLRRAVVDAVLGQRIGVRPHSLSEIERDPRAYRVAHPVDWATGAAMMIDAAVERRIGAWDEQFFLYSEEVDYLRRIREAGLEIWFEPDAIMKHSRGGSGVSDELEALMAVNRVRYQEKLHGHLGALPYRATVVLSSALRMKQRRHRVALGYLLARSRWERLPRGTRAQTSETEPR